MKSAANDPEPWFLVGLVVVGGIWATAAFVAPWYEPLKLLAPQSSTLGGLAILFFGAILSLRIYDSVNRKAERRQVRQEYALTRVRDIYVPLWDETVALLERAETYDFAELRYGGQEGEDLAKHGFDHVMASSLRLFVDSEVAARLFTFHVAVAGYNKAHGIARNEAFEQSKVAAAELTGLTADQGAAGGIANLFMNNIRFVWGATHYGEDAQRAMRDRFREMFDQARPAAGPKETTAAFDALRDRLQSLDSAKAMRRESQACAAAGKLVIARLEEIVRDPTSVVLEFIT